MPCPRRRFGKAPQKRASRHKRLRQGARRRLAARWLLGCPVGHRPGRPPMRGRLLRHGAAGASARAQRRRDPPPSLRLACSCSNLGAMCIATAPRGARQPSTKQRTPDVQPSSLPAGSRASTRARCVSASAAAALAACGQLQLFRLQREPQRRHGRPALVDLFEVGRHPQVAVVLLQGGVFPGGGGEPAARCHTHAQVPKALAQQAQADGCRASRASRPRRALMLPSP